MATDITLSKGVRQNLLSLQGTAELLNTTQERLSTGKKVNSALDNPINFFTSAGLSSRANDLSRLLDSVGNAVQTVAAADKGISAITKLIESAQATARQALTSAGPATSYAAIAVAATTQTETIAAHNGGAITVTDSTLYSFTIDINGAGPTTVSFTSGVGATYAQIRDGLIADFATQVAAAGFTVGTDIELVANTGGDGIAVNALNADIDFVIGAGAGNSGLTAATYNSTSLLDRVVTAGGADGTSTLTVAVNGGANQVITFGTGAGQVSTLAEFNTALGALTGVTAGVTGTDLTFAVGTSTTQNSLVLTGSTGVGTATGVTNGTTNGTVVSTPNATRTSLQADYNELLSQITQLARDASFNGINLLDSDNLTVTFNEDGTSTLSIAGVDFSATGLNLTTQAGTAFQTDVGVNAAIAELDAATATLRSQASKFGSNLSIVQARQDFTKNLISVLQIGADNLVLADTNEEGANMLALNTRQQLSTVALSLAAQADQNVLRLF